MDFGGYFSRKRMFFMSDIHSAVGGGVPNAPQGTAEKSLSSS